MVVQCPSNGQCNVDHQLAVLKHVEQRGVVVHITFFVVVAVIVIVVSEAELIWTMFALL